MLSIAGHKVVTDVTGNDGLWHFICTTWTSAGGKWSVFKDGVLADSGTNLANGKRVKSGGMIVIGQEQDEQGGKFSAAESFHGRITRLDVWSRVFTPEDVLTIKQQCDPYYGDLLAWSHVYNGLKGHIKVSSRIYNQIKSLFANIYVQISPLSFCNSCPSLDSPENAEIEIQGQTLSMLCQIFQIFSL